VTGRREFEGSQERDEGCQRHVLDELSSDWTCLSFFFPPVSPWISLSHTSPSLPFTHSGALPPPPPSASLALVTPPLPVRSSGGGLDEPTSRAVNGNEARLKRMMASGDTRQRLGRVCEINNFHGPAKNNTRRPRHEPHLRERREFLGRELAFEFRSKPPRTPALRRRCSDTRKSVSIPGMPPPSSTLEPSRGAWRQIITPLSPRRAPNSPRKRSSSARRESLIRIRWEIIKPPTSTAVCDNATRLPTRGASPPPHFSIVCLACSSWQVHLAFAERRYRAEPDLWRGGAAVHHNRRRERAKRRRR